MQDELTLAGYRKHEEASKAPPPLTDAELELKMLNETKVHMVCSQLKLRLSQE